VVSGVPLWTVLKTWKSVELRGLPKRVHGML
jgi:hypothetical protein